MENWTQKFGFHFFQGQTENTQKGPRPKEVKNATSLPVFATFLLASAFLNQILQWKGNLFWRVPKSRHAHATGHVGYGGLNGSKMEAGWRLLGEHVSQSQLLRTLCNTCILPGCSIVGPILPPLICGGATCHPSTLYLYLYLNSFYLKTSI